MADIPFPVTSTPGQRGQETGGRLVNCYAAEVKGAPASGVLWRRVAGSRRILLIPDAAEGVIGARGFVAIGQVLMHFPAGQCYSVIESGGTLSYELRGALAGTQPLTFGQNNKQPTPETVTVTETGAFLITSDGAPAPLGEPNLSSPNSVTELDGYHIYSSPGGRITASQLNDKTIATNSWEDLPERNLSRVVEYNNEIFAFGTNFFRVYRNVGAQPFPLEFTGVKRDVGIASTWAVAGFEEGFPDAMIFAGSDDTVYRMEGYTPVPVSTEPVQRAIQNAVDKSTLVASVYSANGQSFWTLTSPNEWTWEYNIDTGLWHERESYQRPDFRGRSSIYFFDQWIGGDSETPTLLETLSEFPTEFEEPLPWVLESGIMHARPDRVNANWTYLHFSASLGLDRGLIPTQTEPKVKIEWSLNGGGDFGTPILRDLGSEGDYDQEVSFGPTGDSQRKGLQYRFTVTDSVNIGFMGATADLEAAAA